ncbi:MAG: hypothetical protein U0610_24060 [bacterium]
MNGSDRIRGARGVVRRGVGSAALVGGWLLALAGCASVDVIDPWRTGYVPRLHLNDRFYELSMRVVDDCNRPIDGMLVRLRGVRHLNGFRDDPETEFYLFGRSGDTGQPGSLHFRFPAPRDPESFDLYAVLYESDRDVHSTHFIPGKYWYLKWAHHELDLGSDRHAYLTLSPDA